ncbi:unnamed protein product, partial [Allacma fusca]
CGIKIYHQFELANQCEPVYYQTIVVAEPAVALLILTAINNDDDGEQDRK